MLVKSLRALRARGVSPTAHNFPPRLDPCQDRLLASLAASFSASTSLVRYLLFLIGIHSSLEHFR